jgi:hypothetical protein
MVDGTIPGMNRSDLQRCFRQMPKILTTVHCQLIRKGGTGTIGRLCECDVPVLYRAVPVSLSWGKHRVAIDNLPYALNGVSQKPAPDLFSAEICSMFDFLFYKQTEVCVGPAISACRRLREAVKPWPLSFPSSSP